MALIFLRHVILTIVYCTMTSHAMVSRTFTLKTNSSGSKVCALDKPSTVIAMGASTMAGQCGTMCNVDPSCELFQFKDDLANCELFDYLPSNFSAVEHCTSYVTPPDIDECATNNGGCSQNAVCNDIVGSFTCSCKTGFTGNGVNCTNIVECATNNGGCSQNAVCNDTVGSFTCSCKTGFTGNGVNCTRTPTLVAQWAGTTGVLTTALLNDQLFVTRYGASHVSVYNTSSFQLIRTITFSGLGTMLYGLATSAVENYLYVSDFINQRMHRVDLSVTNTVSVVSWSVPNTPRGLSITSENTVLVTMNGGTISEYTPSGSLVRTVIVSNTPIQAVQVNNNVWAYVGLGSMDAICTITTSGAVIKCFGSVAGPGLTLAMNYPVAMVINTRGNMLVADSYNSRILVVDPNLTSARELQLPVTPAVRLPYALSDDQSLGRLYVGEGGDLKRVLVFDDIQW